MDSRVPADEPEYHEGTALLLTTEELVQNMVGEDAA